MLEPLVVKAPGRLTGKVTVVRGAKCRESRLELADRQGIKIKYRQGCNFSGTGSFMKLLPRANDSEAGRGETAPSKPAAEPLMIRRAQLSVKGQFFPPELAGLKRPSQTVSNSRRGASPYNTSYVASGPNILLLQPLSLEVFT